MQHRGARPSLTMAMTTLMKVLTMHMTAGMDAAPRGQAQSNYDSDYSDEGTARQTGPGSTAATAGSTASQLARAKSQQSLANSGFDDDAMMEDESAGGLQGSSSGSRQGQGCAFSNVKSLICDGAPGW